MVNASSFKTTVSYLELFKRCPSNQVTKLDRLHSKHKEYLRRVNKLPECLPQIHWEHYRQNVRKEDVPIVHAFEKAYQYFKVPYPCAEKHYKELEEQCMDVQAEVKAFVEDSNKRIEHYKNEIKRIQSLTPYTEMTMQQFYEEVPEQALNFINNPTFWPHTPEEQIGAKSEIFEIVSKNRKGGDCK